MTIFLYAATCWPVVAVLLVAAICRAVHKSKLRDEGFWA